MKLLDTSCLSLFLLEILAYDFLNELYESLNIIFKNLFNL